MTDQADLERAYRRLPAWYPRAFRQENGQEILAVLMAGARDGQRRPGLAESADLIRSGLWMRLRPSVPRSARTVRAAVGSIYAGAAVSTVNLIIVLLGPIVLVLTWLAGAAAVWLLWRSASGAFFNPPGSTRARRQAQTAERAHQAQMAEVARIRARLPRQV